MATLIHGFPEVHWFAATNFRNQDVHYLENNMRDLRGLIYGEKYSHNEALAIISCTRIKVGLQCMYLLQQKKLCLNCATKKYSYGNTDKCSPSP